MLRAEIYVLTTLPTTPPHTPPAKLKRSNFSTARQETVLYSFQIFYHQRRRTFWHRTHIILLHNIIII